MTNLSIADWRWIQEVAQARLEESFKKSGLPGRCPQVPSAMVEAVVAAYQEFLTLPVRRSNKGRPAKNTRSNLG